MRRITPLNVPGGGILARIQTLTRFLELDDSGDHDAALAYLREQFARFNAGDRSVLFEVLDDDVDWKIPEIFPTQEIAPGRTGIEAFLEDQFELFDDFAIEPEDYIRNGDRIAILVRQRGRGRASGVPIEIRIAQVWTLSGGRVVRFEGVSSQDDARRMITSQ